MQASSPARIHPLLLEILAEVAECLLGVLHLNRLLWEVEVLFKDLRSAYRIDELPSGKPLFAHDRQPIGLDLARIADIAAVIAWAISPREAVHELAA